MTTKAGYTRTNIDQSKYYRHVPIDILHKKWGPKKSVKDIQDNHYTTGENEHTTTNNDIEIYAAEVEKQFHKNRKEEWMKGYMKNYISRNAKGMDLYKI